MNVEEIKYSIKNLMSRKLRSYLTVLSILIGITAVFALVSFGLGIKNYVNVLAEEAGADKLYIQAASASAPGLDDSFSITSEDLGFVGKVNGVKKVAGMYMKVGEIDFKGESAYNFLIGYNTDNTEFLFEGFNVDILKGRELKDGQKSKVTLGYNYQLENKVFDRALSVGDKVEINGEKFEVIGFYTEVGNPADDANIYVTEGGFETLFPESKDKYGMAMIQAQPGVDVNELEGKIRKELRNFRGEEEGKETFYVQTFEDVLEIFTSIINIINGVLLLIALISVIVASVNIMNTMYTSVLERTKEIGIMKAIGARNSDIGFIFVFESGFLGLVGGILGILFGYVIASFGGFIAAQSGYSALYPIFPWYLIAACLFFAFSVGAISGVLPALHASKLNPVDALRYE